MIHGATLVVTRESCARKTGYFLIPGFAEGRQAIQAGLSGNYTEAAIHMITGTAEVAMIFMGGQIVEAVLVKAFPLANQGFIMLQAGATGEAAAAAGKGAELTSSQLKSIQSFENLIAEHGQKLAQFIKDPYAFDNKGFLKNAPTPEIARKIIDARIWGLQQEIQTFQENIQKILGGQL